jgi:hypothetical protein
MCFICDGESYEDHYQRVDEHIATIGWSLIGVESPPGLAGQGWAYTIGLIESFGHPELIVTGRQVVDAGRILNSLGELVRGGSRLKPGESARLGPNLVGVCAVDATHLERGRFAAWIDYYTHRSGPPSWEALQVICGDELCCWEHQRSAPRLDVGDIPAARPGDNRETRRAMQRQRRHRWSD